VFAVAPLYHFLGVPEETIGFFGEMFPFLSSRSQRSAAVGGDEPTAFPLERLCA
jgi:hypothetical protein